MGTYLSCANLSDNEPDLEEGRVSYSLGRTNTYAGLQTYCQYDLKNPPPVVVPRSQFRKIHYSGK